MFTILPAVAIMSCGQGDGTGSTGIVKPGEGDQAGATANEEVSDKGIGPITSVTLAAEVDQELAATGLALFTSKGCTACHKAEEKFIGPALKDVDDRRTPEWIMNMILNPDEMVKKDPVAKALLIEFNGSPMANQNLTEEEARAVLEYFRSI